MNIFKPVLFAIALLATSQSAHARETLFSKMELAPKQNLVSAMADVLPAYIDATQGVLKEIDALPAGTVSETTRLSKIPIAGLFERNAVVLDKSKLLSDRDFTGGRDDHDIAWLRQSLEGLLDLRDLVEFYILGAKVDLDIDKYVTVMGYLYRGPNEYNYQAIIEPVSRFYCNLQFNVEREPGDIDALVIAEETCD